MDVKIKAIIFAGGEINSYNFLKDFNFSDYLIICADSGFYHAKNLGLDVDILVGDMDSIREKDYTAKEIVKLNPEKDDTDTVSAIKKAYETYIKEITIIGGVGSRIDHTLNNISSLLMIESMNIKGYILGENFKMYLCSDNEEIQKQNYKYFSLIVLNDKTDGVNISGAKYNLNNATLKSDYPMAVSNEFLENTVKISYNKGKMLLILTNE